MENSEPRKIPKEVRDERSYLKYCEIMDLPVMERKNRLIYTSKTDLVIDPLSHIHLINESIKHLPKDEVSYIANRTRAYKVLYSRASFLYKTAFGVKKNKHSHSLGMKILDERSAELIEYFGAMMSDKEVLTVIKRDWGYDTSVAVIKAFRIKYQDQIDQKKVVFKEDWSHIRLAHIRGRLEELCEMYKVTKTKWKTTQTKSDLDIMMKILKQIQVETQDTTIRIEANITAQVEHVLSGHIESQASKSLAINEIIMARAARKLGCSSMTLVDQLHNSYYSKYSGILGEAAEADETVLYPSQLAYDWQKIEEYHKREIEEAEVVEVSQSSQDKAALLKAQLMEKISERKERLNTSIDRTDQIKPEDE